jgi:16S rRNA (cytosine967-C5)-methyltransferase
VVLVDAPCSSSGVLRRRPSLRWALDPHQALHALPLLQADLLGRAAAMVREGGVLLYATCSLLRQENQGVALRWVLLR